MVGWAGDIQDEKVLWKDVHNLSEDNMYSQRSFPFYVKRDRSPLLVGSDIDLKTRCLFRTVTLPTASTMHCTDQKTIYEQTKKMSTCQKSEDMTKKKKKPRSVRALSTDQLARKRTSDREAQRLFRQRNREQISSLQERAAECDRKEELLEQTFKRNASLEAEVLAIQSELTKVTCMLEEQRRREAHALAWTPPYGGSSQRISNVPLLSSLTCL